MSEFKIGRRVVKALEADIGDEDRRAQERGVKRYAST